MNAAPSPSSLSCLLLPAGDNCWLAPATLVVEVIAHFDDTAPQRLAWRGLQLPCVDGTGGRVRALAVLRRLGAAGDAFYALALREPPRPLEVHEGMLDAPVGGGFDLAEGRARLFDTDAIEALLPSP